MRVVACVVRIAGGPLQREVLVTPWRRAFRDLET